MSESKNTIITPGPEFRERINQYAARLSTFDKPKADAMIAKVLASDRRDEFLYSEASHIFYPYFLSKLNEYIAHPENRPEPKSKGDKGKATAAAGTSSSATAATTTTVVTTENESGTIRSGGSVMDPKREEALKQAEAEARRYLNDPYPAIYSLDLRDGTIDLPALTTDIISLTAQYVAKYGDAFLSTVMAKQKRSPDFRFLNEEDIRYPVFKGLVDSYKRILNFDLDATETRLENFGKPDILLGSILEDKTKYVMSSLARRKAALLTDDELKAKLNWNTFKILHSFTLGDLKLDGVVPDTAISKQYLLRAALRSHAMKVDASPDDGEGAASEGGDEPNRSAPPVNRVGMKSIPDFTPTFLSSDLTQGAVKKRKVEDERPAFDPTAIENTVEDEEDYEVDAITGARLKRKRV